MKSDIKQSKMLADASGQGRERRSGPRVMSAVVKLFAPAETDIQR